MKDSCVLYTYPRPTSDITFDIDTPGTTTTIDINGAVMVPGQYEYRNNEKLGDLINICGGYQSNADLSNIEITKFLSEIKEIDLFSTTS